MSRIRWIIGALLAGALALAGGIAFAAPSPSPSPHDPVASRPLALTGGASDEAAVQRWAGQTMSKTGRVKAARVSGPQVRSLLFGPGEHPGPGHRFDKELLATRVDGAENIDTSFIPAPPGHRVPPMRAVVTIIDPDDGSFISAIFIGADEEDKAKRFELEPLGQVVPVDVGAGFLRSTTRGR